MTSPRKKTEYEKERDKLIPMAVKFADMKCPVLKTLEQKEEWNKLYLQEMDRLSKEKGLTGFTCPYCGAKQ
jgi:hypothetical protein